MFVILPILVLLLKHWFK